jgi:hypothetical protein
MNLRKTLFSGVNFVLVGAIALLGTTATYQVYELSKRSSDDDASMFAVADTPDPLTPTIENPIPSISAPETTNSVIVEESVVTKPAVKQPKVTNPVTTPVVVNQEIVPTTPFYIDDAGRGGWAIFPSGTEVIIPPHYFVDKYGSPVDGRVDLKYRELRNPVDFYFGEQVINTKENTNLIIIDIEAYQGGVPVNIRGGKLITIKLKTTEADNNTYLCYVNKTQCGVITKNK